MRTKTSVSEDQEGAAYQTAEQIIRQTAELNGWHGHSIQSAFNSIALGLSEARDVGAEHLVKEYDGLNTGKPLDPSDFLYHAGLDAALGAIGMKRAAYRVCEAKEEKKEKATFAQLP